MKKRRFFILRDGNWKERIWSPITQERITIFKTGTQEEKDQLRSENEISVDETISSNANNFITYRVPDIKTIISANLVMENDVFNKGKLTYVDINDNTQTVGI